METSTHVDEMPTTTEEHITHEEEGEEGEEEDYSHELPPPVATVREFFLYREILEDVLF